MTKCWIDFLTPKQLYFAKHLSQKLKERGYSILLTTRRYREVDDLLKLKKIKAIQVGTYGGRALKDKLKASSLRIIKLVELIEREKPNVAISFASPEAARVSYGLKIPHICICDSPHAEAVCRLTVPLSARLLTPKVIPVDVWKKYGIPEHAIIRYNALDPIVWLKNLKLDPSVLEELSLRPERPIITIRVEESYASYLHEVSKSVTFEVTSKLLNEFKDMAQIVALPRYAEQLELLRKLEGLIVPSSAIDGPSLLSHSSIFIGAGGTMTTEAALLGVPTISCYPGEIPFVQRYLLEKGLMIHTLDPNAIINKVAEWLVNLDQIKRRQGEKAKELWAEMEDPTVKIIEVIEDVIREQ